MTTALTAVLLLTSCGSGSGNGQADNGRTSPRTSPSVTATPTPSSPVPASQSPSGAGASDAPATPPEIMPVYQSVYGLVGTPACTGVPWDDAGCGKDLTAAGEVADAMTRHMQKHFPGGEYADAKKAAGQVARAVNMLRKAGCYGMTPKPPKTSPDKLRELCPTLSTVASLSWLSLEGSLDVF
ncbi:hypothetical protein ACIGW1_12475 [Streptomyces sp. NPDC053780]|uniref:hypothetical protein n=1 Tax=unclassified Streptomyces TaxID=2593676 RepID=UPI00341ACAD9